jgi:hypothetical protein
MEYISSKANQLPHRQQPLLNPIVHSASLRKSVAILTCEEARRQFLEAADRQHGPMTIWHRLRAAFYLCDVCREWSARLGNLLLRLAVRWPRLEILLPSVRKTGQLAALLDRVEIESGGALSTSAPSLLVRRLKAYREEVQKLIVTKPEIS